MKQIIIIVVVDNTRRCLAWRCFDGVVEGVVVIVVVGVGGFYCLPSRSTCQFRVGLGT